VWFRPSFSPNGIAYPSANVLRSALKRRSFLSMGGSIHASSRENGAVKSTLIKVHMGGCVGGAPMRAASNALDGRAKVHLRFKPRGQQGTRHRPCIFPQDLFRRDFPPSRSVRRQTNIVPFIFSDRPNRFADRPQGAAAASRKTRRALGAGRARAGHPPIPLALVKDLPFSRAQPQMVEISKGLARKAAILIPRRSDPSAADGGRMSPSVVAGAEAVLRSEGAGTDLIPISPPR